MLRRIILANLLLVGCTSLYADVTMRMGFDLKVNLTLPTPMPQLPFNEMVTRIKGDRAYVTMGPVNAITDLSTGKIMLLDPKARLYASLAMADYLAKAGGATGRNMQGMPEEAKQILANIKFDSESRDTGRTDRIQGIEAFEREVAIHVSIPVPIPGQENGLQLNLKLQIWKPTAAEFQRVPQLRELAAYNDRNKGVGDPATVIRQMFGSVPGIGDRLSKVVEEMTAGGNAVLGMHLGLFVPGLAKLAEQAGAKGALPTLPPDDQPLAEVTLNLKEFSASPVKDELFVIPAGFKEAPVEDILKALTTALTGGKPEPAPAPAPKKNELNLRVEPSGTDLLVTWNKDSATITGTSHGELSINDGDKHETYDMDSKQLQTGSIVYTPVTRDVSFQLELTGTGQGTRVNESLNSAGTPSTPPGSAGLGFCAEPSGADLLLTWHKDSAMIANASHGVLSINDGDKHEHFDMDPKQLQTGSIVYTPVTGEVTFKLEVTGTDQSQTVTESVHSSHTPPAPRPPTQPGVLQQK